MGKLKVIEIVVAVEMAPTDSSSFKKKDRPGNAGQTLMPFPPLGKKEGLGTLAVLLGST